MNKEQREPTATELNKIMSLSDELRSVRVRAEGEVNQMWDFTLKDPTTDTYYEIGCYAYESSPQFNFDDGRVWDINKRFAQFLDDLFDSLNNHYPKNFDEYSDACDFHLYNRGGQLELTDVYHQVQKDNIKINI